MKGSSRPFVALALAELIGLVSAGCGSDASSDTASASSTGTSGPDPGPKGDYNFGVDVTEGCG